MLGDSLRYSTFLPFPHHASRPPIQPKTFWPGTKIFLKYI